MDWIVEESIIAAVLIVSFRQSADNGRWTHAIAGHVGGYKEREIKRDAGVALRPHCAEAAVR